VDDGIDKFMDMLEDTCELDNTYILYTSDHGFHIGQFGLPRGKSMPYDFDIRVPFYLKGPGIEPDSKFKDIVLNIDVAPTLLALAGVEIPDSLDGRDFMPLIKNRDSLQQPWRSSFLVERGNIPRINKHLAKPVLPTKQDRVNQLCKAAVYQFPCVGNQTWTCVREEPDMELKLKKCSHFREKKPPRTVPRRRICPCQEGPSVNAIIRGAQIEHNRCMRKLSTVNKRVSKLRYRRDVPNPTALPTALNYDFNFDTQQLGVNVQQTTNTTTEDGYTIPMSDNCVLYPVAQEIRCTYKKQGNKDKNWTKIFNQFYQRRSRARLHTIQRMKQSQVRYQCNRLLNKVVTEKQKCTCVVEEPKIPVEKVTKKKLIDDHFQEVKNKHIEEKQVFKEAKEAYLDEQKKLKLKKEIRKQTRNITKQGHGEDATCSKVPSVSCFALTQEKWQTPPRWTGDNRCYCTNSNNNTYWCVRIINETADMLYCEFITSFVEFYNLKTDPHQLANTYSELSPEMHTALHHELSLLRGCRGRSCDINKPTPVTTTPTPPQTTATVPTSIAPETTPEMDVKSKRKGLGRPPKQSKQPHPFLPVLNNQQRRPGVRRKGSGQQGQQQSSRPFGGRQGQRSLLSTERELRTELRKRLVIRCMKEFPPNTRGRKNCLKRNVKGAGAIMKSAVGGKKFVTRHHDQRGKRKAKHRRKREGKKSGNVTSSKY